MFSKIQKALRGVLCNDVTTLVLRIALLYVVFFIARIAFYFANADTIGELTAEELPQLLRGALMFDTASILYVNLLFILLSLLPFRFRAKEWYQRLSFWVYVVINSVALIVALADVVYFRYVQKRFTAIEMFFADNDNTSELILKFTLENWWLVFLWIFFVVVLVWGWKKIPYYATEVRRKAVYYPLSFVLLLLGAWLCFGGIRGGLWHGVRPITLSNASLYASTINKANLILSNPFCVVRTLGYKKTEVKRYFDNEKLNALYQPINTPAHNSTFGIKKGANVVLFVLESFSAEHSALLNPDLYPDGNGYTPFLDSLMQEGYYFTSGFANGRKSIDALPSILSSIPSYDTPFVLLPNSMGEKESMPSLLAEQGYKTMFFNGSQYGSMGFGAYAAQAGIEKYYAREDFEKERGYNDFDGYWGIWDEPFIDYMGEVLSASEQPFFASIFTLSSHHPFTVPAEYDSLPAGVTKIHKGVRYTDISVKNFFRKYSSEPWFANTLFVFVADHVSSETFAPKTKTPTGNSHIIYFYYTPDKSLYGVDHKVGQQIDIMPAVLHFTGIDRPYYAYGRNTFNEADTSDRMAITWVGGGLYQAITDSLVMMFDGDKILRVFDRKDTLQTKDIKDVCSETATIEERVKARLQQYYEHVERRDYKLKTE